MKLLEIVTGPWAILPQTLLEIQGIYTSHLRGEKISIPEVESKLGIKLDNRHGLLMESAVGQKVDNSYETFSVVDGIAVIPVHDVIGKRMNLFMAICGGASAQLIQRDIQRAMDDPKVKGIMLYVDSPGGTVDGTQELAQFIYESRGQKPIVAFTDGMMASAAYWIGSACDSVYISGDTNPVGSIGVVAGHRDVSGAEAQRGVKTTEITAGKYKRIASQYAPLTDEGQADIQGKVDYLYNAFVGDVARNRGTTPDQVHTDMADGRVFTGMQSVDNGLVDGVSTMNDLIAQMSAGKIQTKKPQQKPTRTGAVAGETTFEETTSMTKDELKAQHPAVYQSIFDEGKNAGASSAAETVAGEKTRIFSLVSAAFGEEPGKKFSAAADKGLTADDFKTLGISFTGSAEGKDVDTTSRAEILAALKDGGQRPLKTTKSEEGGKGFMALVKEYQEANPKADLAEAMKAVAKSNPEAHAAYITNANEGRK